MSVNTLLLGAIATLGSAAAAQPLGDSIPPAFQGTFASERSKCMTPHGVDLIEITADRVHYYEGDDYLLLGVAFDGESTATKKVVPLFNGRFTGRMETQLLGEINVRYELETPDTIARFPISVGGQQSGQPSDRLYRCLKFAKDD